MSNIREEWQTEDGSVRLILGDCMEVLPTLEGIGSIVADPQYGIDYENAGGFCESSGWVKHEKLGWDQERPVREYFDLARAKSRVQIFWGGNYFADYLPSTMRWLIWDKGQSGFSLADCEMAWTSQNKATRRLLLPRAIANKEPRLHWTQKPVKLMEWSMEICCKADDLICDTHMGSCTTGVACIRTGRKFIGIDKEPKYFEVSKARIQAELSRLRLFEPPQPLVQRTMFT